MLHLHQRLYYYNHHCSILYLYVRYNKQIVEQEKLGFTKVSISIIINFNDDSKQVLWCTRKKHLVQFSSFIYETGEEDVIEY